MDLAGVVAAVVFGATLLLTAAAQRLWRTRPLQWLKTRDAFALIPSWTFFAPNPGVEDTRILWRERFFDGSTSPWHELAAPRGGLVRAVWNPEKRARKAITDTGPALARRIGKQPKNKLILLSIPYLMLLSYVTSQPRSPLGEARQFMVVRTKGADQDEESEPRVILVSHWHAIDESSRGGEPSPEVRAA